MWAIVLLNAEIEDIGHAVKSQYYLVFIAIERLAVSFLTLFGNEQLSIYPQDRIKS
jgi:hypothetical protein